LTYQNIVILSDMSDRLQPKINGEIKNQQYPPLDTIEIQKIIDYFKNECVKPGEKIGDNSCIAFATFSNSNFAKVDVGLHAELGEKQQFINSTGKFENRGLIFELHEFESKVKNFYGTIRNDGLDLINALNAKINNDFIIKTNTVFTDGNDTTFINYENHVYIFTDGYLEYKGRAMNDEFYFGSSEIKKLRDYCTENNVLPAEALKFDGTLGIPSLYNKRNELIYLHVMETHSRDINFNDMHPKNKYGLTDNEILQAVWRKWAIDSGFKDITWDQYNSN